MGEPPRMSLRQEFAGWMQSDLGYAAVHTNVRINGASNERANVVDVRGEKWSRETRWLRSAGFMTFGVAVVLENTESVRNAVIVSPNVLLVVSVALLAAAAIAKRRTRKYAWVWCSTQKRRLRLGDIQALRDAVDAYQRRNTVRWTPVEILLVSNEVGFEPDAVELARVLGVLCYRRRDAGFERVA